MSAAVAEQPLPPIANPWRQDVFVAVATLVAGALGYGFLLVMSHALSTSAFGELSTLLGVALLATVPGTALQAGIARRIAASPDAAAESAGIRQGVLLAALVTCLLLLIAPALRSVFAIHGWVSLVWLAGSMAPTTAAFGCLGVLQGQRRFVAFGWLLVAVQFAKFAAGGFASATHSGVDGSLAALTVATTAVAAVALAAMRPHGGVTAVGERGSFRAVLARDAGAVLGILLLTSVDLFLARHYLPKHDAGIYAAGNVVTKVAFWGPSFVATVAYPRLSEPDSRAAALRRGAVTICAFAVVATVAAAVGGSLVPVVVGQKYRAVAHLSWMFALQGAALAAVLFGVYAGLAVHRRALAALVWLVATAETGVIALAAHRSVHQIITVVLVGSVVLVAAAAWEQRAAFVDR